MVIPALAILGIAVGAGVLCALAEVLHARRVARIARLAFGPSARAPRWTAIVPPMRCIGIALAVWGLLTLWMLDGAPADITKSKAPDRHLILALDVSPSMYLQDSGPEAKQPRRERAAHVMTSVLERLDLTRTRISVVAFYSAARPVVVDSFDLNVVQNVINDLPLAQAFKAGQTDMYSGVKEAFKLAERWQPGSTTLVVISDGDTLPDIGLPSTPASIGDVLVVGVGNPYRGSEIAGGSSRQDAPSLKHLAARLRGLYHDGNQHHLPSDVLRSLNMLTLREDTTPALRTIALTAVATGASLLALVAPLLAAFADPRSPRVRTSSRTSAESDSEPATVNTRNDELISV